MKRYKVVARLICENRPEVLEGLLDMLDSDEHARERIAEAYSKAWPSRAKRFFVPYLGRDRRL